MASQIDIKGQIDSQAFEFKLPVAPIDEEFHTGSNVAVEVQIDGSQITVLLHGEILGFPVTLKRTVSEVGEHDFHVTIKGHVFEGSVTLS